MNEDIFFNRAKKSDLFLKFIWRRKIKKIIKRKNKNDSRSKLLLSSKKIWSIFDVHLTEKNRFFLSFHRSFFKREKIIKHMIYRFFCDLFFSQFVQTAKRKWKFFSSLIFKSKIESKHRTKQKTETFQN